MDRAALLIAGDRNLAHYLRLTAQAAPGAALDDDGRLLLISTSPTWPGPYHNGAMRLDRSLPADEVVTRAAEFFASRCAGYCVWIADHADADIEILALNAGLVQISTAGAPRLVLEHEPPAPVAVPGVHLEEVVDEAGRRDCTAVTVEAFAEAPLPADAALAQLAVLGGGRCPGVHAVVARDSGRPVAAALVVVSDEVAGIQLVGTVPSARGRGLGALCTHWAASAGFRLGARAAVLEASEAGDPLYRRMGFVEMSRYRWCMGPAAPR